MAKVQYITAKGADRLARSPFYVGIPQHERSMSKKETYQFLAEKTGVRSTQVRAAFLALHPAYRTMTAKPSGLS